MSQFLASAAGEKLAVVMTVYCLCGEAPRRRREDLDEYLAAVPNVAPSENNQLKQLPISCRKNELECFTLDGNRVAARHSGGIENPSGHKWEITLIRELQTA